MRISLDGNDWQFKGYIGADWVWRNAHLPTHRDQRHWASATVPGSVIHDLLNNHLIPDPYFEDNSLQVEWVPNRTWVYRKAFQAPIKRDGATAALHFEGVDYSAQVFLNGSALGEITGMFTPANFLVTEHLRWGEENLLVVIIEPAPFEQPQVGYSSRVRTHKTRMNYWWDFCPRLVHQGIWDHVWIDITGPVKIEDVWVRSQLTPDLDQAEVSALIKVQNFSGERFRLGARMLQGDVEIEQREVLVAPDTGMVTLCFAIEQPALWWPNAYGEQPFYTLEVRVRTETGENSDDRLQRFGLRKVEWLPNEAAAPEARPHTLVVNNRRIYIQGWNWTPLDALYGPEQPEKLDHLLQLAIQAHVNLLRVWGGGLIEKESFYEMCDQKGILVWQEFIQSSSGIENRPPDDPVFIARMLAEARQIIPRRRNHPSLIIWCGGNELQSAPDRPASEEDSPLLKALGEVVAELDPERRYLPTSPSGPEFGNSLASLARSPYALHDVHGPWEHQGLVDQFTLYNQGTSLLHSEFGIEGITNRRTLDATISQSHQAPISLENPLWLHLGAWWLKENSWRSMLGELQDVETLRRGVQFLQADGLRYAVEANRRRQYQNSGSMPWQFNEPYPMAASTSAVDYYARPKPAYYAVAAAYEPQHVSARFPRQVWEGQREFSAEIWISNANEVPEPAELRIAVAGETGRSYWEDCQTVQLPDGRSKRAYQLKLPMSLIMEDVFFLDLRLDSVSGRNKSANRYIFSRTENLNPIFHLPFVKVSASVIQLGMDWEVSIRNEGRHTGLYLWLEDTLPLRTLAWSILSLNHFCLFPGERKEIRVQWGSIPEVERQLTLQGLNTERLILQVP